MYTEIEQEAKRVSTFEYGMATIGRLLKILVSIAEYSLFYKALLQKRPTILKSLLIEATP